MAKKVEIILINSNLIRFVVTVVHLFCRLVYPYEF